MGPTNPLQIGGGVPNPQPQLNQFMPNQLLNNGNGTLGFNVAQQLGQFMPQNGVNPNQMFSQNVNLGQWNLSNPMQNIGLNTDPFLAMGLSNLVQGISPQNLAILASAQLGLMSANHMGMQVQGNLGIGPPQAQQNHQNYNQAPAQVNLGNLTNNNQNATWKKPPNQKHNQKHDSMHDRSVNSPFYHGQPGKGNFGPSKDRREKGHRDERPRKYIPNQSKENPGEKKRPPVLTYTDQEIKQWREQRRKNYPLQATLQKKLADKTAASEARDEAAKLRRQQLKEILAKQAELGCEVADIPSSYLCDVEQVHREGIKRPFNKKEKFQNKFNKRGRFHQNDRFSKRSESGNHDPSNESQQRDHFNQKQIPGSSKPTGHDGASKKKPTLLQKLLSADIRRENHQLLQVFRFMIMNSFFKDFPEKALKFPPVIIKDADYESPVAEENEVSRGTDVMGPNGSDDGVDNEGVQCNHDQESDGPRKQKVLQEEEGEIID